MQAMACPGGEVIRIFRIIESGPEFSGEKVMFEALRWAMFDTIAKLSQIQSPQTGGDSYQGAVLDNECFVCCYRR